MREHDLLETVCERDTLTTIEGIEDMSFVIGYVVGFVDFSASLTTSQVAELLSLRVFGGISFIEKDVDGEHDLGTLCLAEDFLGLQVDLFGEDGRFTVEIGTRPSASVEGGSGEVGDLSSMLRQRIENLDELELS